MANHRKKLGKYARREIGWDNSSSLTDAMPEYDALNDPFCMISQSKVFRKELKKILRDKDQLSNDFNKQLRKARKIQVEVDLEREEDTENRTKLAASPLGTNQSILECQQAITEKIIEREARVQFIRELVVGVEKVKMSQLLESLTLIRQQNLNVVLDIEKWRGLCGQNDRVFLFHGRNYLLQILADLNFLAESKPVVKALAIEQSTLRNNPFMSPYSLVPGSPSLQSNALSPKTGETKDLESDIVTSPTSPSTGELPSPQHIKPESPKDIGEDPAQTNTGESLPENIVQQAEQILIKELRNNDLRAIKIMSPKKEEQETFSPKFSRENLGEELERWCVEAKGQVKEVASAWGLPKTFEEVKQVASFPTQDDEIGNNSRRRKLGKVKKQKGSKSSKRIGQPLPWSFNKMDSAYRPLTCGSGTPMSKVSRKRPATSHGSAFLAPLDQSLIVKVPKVSFSVLPREELGTDNVPFQEENREKPEGFSLSPSSLLDLSIAENVPMKDALLVVSSVLILLSPRKTVPSVLRWDVLKESLANSNGHALFYSIRDFKNRKIPKFKLEILAPFISDQHFNPTKLAQIHPALGALCAWVVNIVSSRRRTVQILAELLHLPAFSFQIQNDERQSNVLQSNPHSDSYEDEWSESENLTKITKKKSEKETPVSACLNDSEAQTGAIITTLNLEQHGTTFVLSFFLGVKPKGCLVVKCYNPSTSGECRTIVQNIPVNLQRLDEVRLYCKTLKERLKVSLQPCFCISLQGENDLSGFPKTWRKVYGNTRTYNSRKYSISVFVNDLDQLDQTDFLFKVKDSRDIQQPALMKKIKKHEAGVILHHSKYLFQGNDCEELIEAILENMRLRYLDDGLQIVFIRKKPLHNPAKLTHPTDSTKELNLHGSDIPVEELVHEIADAIGTKKKGTKKTTKEKNTNSYARLAEPKSKSAAMTAKPESVKVKPSVHKPAPARSFGVVPENSKLQNLNTLENPEVASYPNSNFSSNAVVDAKLLDATESLKLDEQPGKQQISNGKYDEQQGNSDEEDAYGEEFSDAGDSTDALATESNPPPKTSHSKPVSETNPFPEKSESALELPSEFIPSDHDSDDDGYSNDDDIDEKGYSEDENEFNEEAGQEFDTTKEESSHSSARNGEGKVESIVSDDDNNAIGDNFSNEDEEPKKAPEDDVLTQEEIYGFESASDDNNSLPEEGALQKTISKPDEREDEYAFEESDDEKVDEQPEVADDDDEDEYNTEEENVEAKATVETNAIEEPAKNDEESEEEDYDFDDEIVEDEEESTKNRIAAPSNPTQELPTSPQSPDTAGYSDEDFDDDFET